MSVIAAVKAVVGGQRLQIPCVPQKGLPAVSDSFQVGQQLRLLHQVLHRRLPAGLVNQPDMDPPELGGAVGAGAVEQGRDPSLGPAEGQDAGARQEEAHAREEHLAPGVAAPDAKEAVAQGDPGHGASPEKAAGEGPDRQAPAAEKKPVYKFLDNFCENLTQRAREGRIDAIVGREQEIERVVQILNRRQKNNPCLIGEPGVGKTAIAEGLAQRIADKDVPYKLLDKEVYLLDLTALVAGTQFRGQFESRMKGLIEEIKKLGNIILVIDEVHNIVGAGDSEGSMNAANILKPALSRGEIQVIGATTFNEYRKYIEKDAALERRFQPVMVEEPTEQEAIEILAGVAYKYEEHHKVTITPEALEAAVKLSNRYINDRNLPDKAIDLIDEASASIRLKNMHIPDNLKEMTEQIKKFDLQIERSIRMEAYTQAAELRQNQEALMKKYDKTLSKYEKTQAEKNLVVTDNDIAEVVANWTKIPVKKLTQKESDRLLKLESILHKRVIGQEESVKAVAQTMKRGRVGLQDPNRPIGSFLFLGPTGVGKTELSKALAEAMFGSENALIRVDMSEYMESHSVSKMVGSPPGYVGFEEGGQLSEKVRRNPYSVVLFDEIEKAHPDVFNILLQVLDDGHITDSKGRKVSFKNTVLIMTSNAGAQRIVDPKNLGFAVQKDAKADYEKMKSNVMDEVTPSKDFSHW